MTQESAVQFATRSRIHMGLGVRSLERSVAFYRTLFGQEPTKTRPGYAKFEVAEPPVNLALNEVTGETGPNHPVAHFGGRAMLKGALDRCCAFEFDRRGNVIGCDPRTDRTVCRDCQEPELLEE